MRSTHEDIKQRLPEYASSGSLPEGIKKHIEECPECREELSIVKTLLEAEAPEPDETFFKTLPAKVRLSLGEKDSKDKPPAFLRLIPAFLLIALLTLGGYFISKERAVPGADVVFSNPLSPETMDFSALSEEDIPSPSDLFSDLEETPLSEHSPLALSFRGEIASLDAEEMEGLFEALNETNGKGDSI